MGNGWGTFFRDVIGVIANYYYIARFYEKNVLCTSQGPIINKIRLSVRCQRSAGSGGVRWCQASLKTTHNWCQASLKTTHK